MPAIRPLNLRHLLAAAAVARQGGISRAADEMHLTQPALTQAIARLETALGERLFARTSCGTSLTPEGEIFVPRVERAFDALRGAERMLPGAPQLHRTAAAVHWRCLAAVLEQRGVRQAATALGLTQQSVHRAILALEAYCGTRLFLRTRQGLEPLPAARVLARGASLAFEELSLGEAELRERRGLMDGRITIGALPLSRSHLVPQAATNLLQRYPEARLQIIDGPYNELLDGLINGRIDCIVGALRLGATTAGIVQEKWFSEPLSIIVRPGHPILAQKPDIQALAALSWVVPREGTPARESFNLFFAAAGLPPPRHVVECSSLVAARGLLLQSDRGAIFSHSQIRYELATGQLAALGYQLPGSERPIGVTTRRDWQPTQLQAAWIEALRETARNVAGIARGDGGAAARAGFVLA
jgi:DNA-binding transcriptional LysR family regulator